MDAAAREVIGYVWTYFKKARFCSDSQPDVCVLHISARRTRYQFNFITVLMSCQGSERHPDVRMFSRRVFSDRSPNTAEKETLTNVETQL